MHRDLLARVARAIRRDCQAGPDDRVAAAVSAGPDSVALVWLLHALGPDTGVSLAGLIHVNHQLRGAASDADEAFCRDLAARLNLPIAVLKADVAGLAQEGRLSIESAARKARYAAFESGAATLDATLVATGHTEDDQAETVLLRLLRGTGARGLSSIRVRRDRYIRPLLQCRRRELRTYLEARGEAWRDDASNADTTILRNRIRHEVLPVIQRVAPEAVAALARAAAHAAEDEAILMAEAIKNRPALVLSDETPGRLEIDAHALSLLPTAIARRVVRALLAEIAPGTSMSAVHLEAVCRLCATDKPVGHLDLPGAVVERIGDQLRMDVSTGARAVSNEMRWPLRRLAVPGEVLVPETGLTIEARFETAAGRSGEWHERHAGTSAELQTDAVRLPLAVRNRRPGDRFRPLGAPGRRKLQDVLVDRKIPRLERDRVALVVDADDRIVWVAGVAVSHDCRVTAPERGVLILNSGSSETRNERDL